jgi:hypothetical protein
MKIKNIIIDSCEEPPKGECEKEANMCVQKEKPT